MNDQHAKRYVRVLISLKSVTMSEQEPTWPLPFKGRNHSGAYSQNFVWKCGSVYVMDNHRAALWCWLQELDLKSSHSLFHIDRHTDTLQSRLKEWMKHLPSWSSSLEEYLMHSYKYEMGMIPVIRWDNYLSIYLEEFGSNLDSCYFATHCDGDKPNHDRVMTAKLWDLPENMDYWLGRPGPWIVNIDLDYFFWNSEETPGVMMSNDYIEKTFTPLRHAIDDGRVAVTTICLTPDPPFTSGWDATEKLAGQLLHILGIDFKLPKEPSKTKGVRS